VLGHEKEIKLFDLVLALADRNHYIGATAVDPITLTRAAKDYLDMEPACALSSWITVLHYNRKSERRKIL